MLPRIPTTVSARLTDEPGTRVRTALRDGRPAPRRHLHRAGCRKGSRPGESPLVFSIQTSRLSQGLGVSALSVPQSHKREGSSRAPPQPSTPSLRTSQVSSSAQTPPEKPQVRAEI